MKREYVPVIALCFVLLLNIVFTQYAVNTYFYQKYALTILFSVLNLLTFPIAILIYKRGAR